jgi:lysozyme
MMERNREAYFAALRLFAPEGHIGTDDFRMLDSVARRWGLPEAAALGLLQPSQRCIDLIKSFEQCRLSSFLPTPRDRPTIGWGATGPDIRLGMTWTQAQADARFESDLLAFATGVNHLLGGAATSQNEFDALVSFAYNVGLDDDADSIAEGLGDSTLLRKHLAGDKAGAADEFAKWDKQKGVVLNGLVRRRAAEADLYRGKIA